jgi:hypothetical protein
MGGGHLQAASYRRARPTQRRLVNALATWFALGFGTFVALGGVSTSVLLVGSAVRGHSIAEVSPGTLGALVVGIAPTTGQTEGVPQM